MINLQDWEMTIWTRDRRFRDGWRVYGTYIYRNRHDKWMQEEVRDLQMGAYPSGKFTIEVNPTTVTVQSLMTGEPVVIPWRAQGTASDPSQERFWST